MPKTHVSTVAECLTDVCRLTQLQFVADTVETVLQQRYTQWWLRDPEGRLKSLCVAFKSKPQDLCTLEKCSVCNTTKKLRAVRIPSDELLKGPCVYFSDITRYFSCREINVTVVYKTQTGAQTDHVSVHFLLLMTSMLFDTWNLFTRCCLLMCFWISGV